MKISSTPLAESVLDFPRDGLDPSVWKSESDGRSQKFTLQPECREKIMKIVDFIVRSLKIPQCQVNITGSITSNSYTSDSDIDLHFGSSLAKREHSDDLIKLTRDALQRYIELNGRESCQIGGHPVEVYFQTNPFQDMMSVGCYSILDDKWIVGPEFSRRDFNPYEEYYDEDMKYVNNLVGQARDVILRAYEQALVFGKISGDTDLKKTLGEAAELFKEARESRKALSEPKSAEEALKLRTDRKWKIADSAFKLLDKFGYLAILKEMSACFTDGAPDREAAERVVKVVRDNLGPKNKKLHEIDLSEDEHDQSEKINIWVDDIRQSPFSYVWIKSVNDFVSFVEQHGVDRIGVVDIDHDAGDFSKDGGDYIRCLDYLEMIGARDIGVRIHSGNPVGVQNMRRVLKRNGWREVMEIVESEQTQMIDEGIGSTVSTIALAFALSLPGLVSAKTLQFASQSSKLSKVQLQQKKSWFDNAFTGIDMTAKVDGLTFAQRANIIAATYYGEGRSEIRNGGFDCIVDTTLNRASGDTNKIVGVCIAKRAGMKFQYSFWNGNKSALASIKAGKVVVPAEIKDNVIERRAWDHCLTRAVDVLTGEYVAKNKKINSYYKTDMKNPPSWAKIMTDKVVVGDHTFGYVASNDPANVDMVTLKRVSPAKQRTYVVKAGDALSKIAKMFNTTVAKIMKDNDLRDANKLKIGQTLKV